VSDNHSNSTNPGAVGRALSRLRIANEIATLETQQLTTIVRMIAIAETR
jgi:hypothetical protein